MNAHYQIYSDNGQYLGDAKDLIEAERKLWTWFNAMTVQKDGAVVMTKGGRS